jgi:oligopeptide transport system substrate-binding protein
MPPVERTLIAREEPEARVCETAAGFARTAARSAFAAMRVAACVSAMVFAGCAKHDTPAQPKGVLRISQRNEPVDLDPATASLPDEFFVIRALGEGLLVPNPAGGAPLPAAARHFEVSSDGLRYTFQLREDGRWSNGEPVTADDFVASFRRALAPSTAAPKAHLFYAVKNARAYASGAISDFSVVGIRATGPRTLTITLDHRTPRFPLYVASGPWIPVNPRVVERFGRTWTEPAHHVGNGPFVLAEWRPQQRITVHKNPAYRDASHVWLEEIQFIRFDNQDTEERAFRAGQVDVTMAVPQTKLETYAHEHPDELHRAPLAETRFISFNTRRAPLNDLRVRQALALAIDRQRLVAQVLRGGQQPAHRFLSPALRKAGPEPANERSFNPEAARRLLAEAGYPNGNGFPRLEFAGWDRNPALEAIQEMWRRELGVEVRLVVQEAKVHLAALTAGNYDIAFVTNLLDVADPVAALQDFTGGAPNNFPHWHSEPFDARVASAAHNPDPRAETSDLTTAEALLLESAAVAPVYFNVQNWLMSDRVHGWAQDPLWDRRYNDVTVE